MLRGLCVHRFDMTMSSAETAEPIEMPFGCGLGWAKQPCRSQWFSGRGSQNNGVDDTQCAANDLVLTTAAVTRGYRTTFVRG